MFKTFAETREQLPQQTNDTFEQQASTPYNFTPNKTRRQVEYLFVKKYIRNKRIKANETNSAPLPAAEQL
jgi:hypothetical protein